VVIHLNSLQVRLRTKGSDRFSAPAEVVEIHASSAKLILTAVLAILLAAESQGQVASAPDANIPSANSPAQDAQGFLATIRASIFEKADTSAWRPLPISTFFSEGWDEVWTPSPKGSGGAPRFGWINAAAGHLTRAQFLTFAQGFNRAAAPDGYLGEYTLLTPLNRRLLIVTNVPFVLRNEVDSGLPILSPSPRGPRRFDSQTGFGDISITPRTLLHETKDFSMTAEMAVVTPTGTPPLAGSTTILIPAISFWNNVAGRFVVRGGIGVLFPTDGSEAESIGQLAVGQTLTDHDVPIVGDFTYYLSAVANTPLTNSELTRVTLTPGIRTHLGRNWSLLIGLPTPVTKERVADLGLICWFLKSW
jgi:hypothetical protein